MRCSLSLSLSLSLSAAHSYLNSISSRLLRAYPARFEALSFPVSVAALLPCHWGAVHERARVCMRSDSQIRAPRIEVERALLRRLTFRSFNLGLREVSVIRNDVNWKR